VSPKTATKIWAALEDAIQVVMSEARRGSGRIRTSEIIERAVERIAVALPDVTREEILRAWLHYSLESQMRMAGAVPAAELS
jgi:hypothetical protein